MALPYQILHTTVNPTLVVLLLNESVIATVDIMALVTHATQTFYPARASEARRWIVQPNRMDPRLLKAL